MTKQAQQEERGAYFPIFPNEAKNIRDNVKDPKDRLAVFDNILAYISGGAVADLEGLPAYVWRELLNKHEFGLNYRKVKAEAGRNGGRQTSEAKAKAARENASKAKQTQTNPSKAKQSQAKPSKPKHTLHNTTIRNDTKQDSTELSGGGVCGGDNPHAHTRSPASDGDGGSAGDGVPLPNENEMISIATSTLKIPMQYVLWWINFMQISGWATTKGVAIDGRNWKAMIMSWWRKRTEEECDEVNSWYEKYGRQS